MRLPRLHTHTMFGRTNRRRERQNSIYHLWKRINTEWNDFRFVWPIHLLFTNHFSRKQKMENTSQKGGERNKSSFINCQKSCRYHCCCCCLNPFAVCAREKGRKSCGPCSNFLVTWLSRLTSNREWNLPFQVFPIVCFDPSQRPFQNRKSASIERRSARAMASISFFTFVNDATEELMARQTNYSISIVKATNFLFCLDSRSNQCDRQLVLVLCW